MIQKVATKVLQRKLQRLRNRERRNLVQQETKKIKKRQEEGKEAGLKEFSCATIVNW